MYNKFCAAVSRTATDALSSLSNSRSWEGHATHAQEGSTVTRTDAQTDENTGLTMWRSGEAVTRPAAAMRMEDSMGELTRQASASCGAGATVRSSNKGARTTSPARFTSRNDGVAIHCLDRMWALKKRTVGHSRTPLPLSGDGLGVIRRDMNLLPRTPRGLLVGGGGPNTVSASLLVRTGRGGAGRARGGDVDVGWSILLTSPQRRAMSGPHPGLRLYRTILRLHRQKLPEMMRGLGDDYVRYVALHGGGGDWPCCRRVPRGRECRYRRSGRPLF